MFYSVEVSQDQVSNLLSVITSAVPVLRQLSSQSLLTVQFIGADDYTQPLRPLQSSDEPTTWSELYTFVKKIGFIEIQIKTKGGADHQSGDGQDGNAGQLLIPPSAYYRDLDWNALDEAVEHIRSGRPPLNQAETVWTQAAALCAGIELQQLDCLQTIQPQPFPLKISAARVAALQLLMNRNPPTVQPLPGWARGLEWLAVRFNGLRAGDLLMGQTSRGGPSQQHMDLMTGFRSFLLTIVPELHLARHAGVNQEMVQLIIDRTRLYFDLKSSQYLSITTILPEGDWRQDLMTGVRPLPAGIYLTLDSTEGLVEVALTQQSGANLMTLGRAMRTDERSFRSLLASAFSTALGGTFVQVRLSTERTGNPKPTYFNPGSPQSEIIVGLDLATLLMARRRASTLHLLLGFRQEIPVEMHIAIPAPPLAALHGLIKAAKPGPVLLHPLGRSPELPLTSSDLVFGPLPRDWLSKLALGRDPNQEMAAMLRILTAIRQNYPGVEPVFVGREGSTPFALLLNCSSTEVATLLIATFCQESPLAQIIEAAFTTIADLIFETLVPRECLTLMGEKTLRETITQWRRDHQPVSVAPPPPPDDRA
jgi:hypothetical protein